jgi:putative transposase
MESVKCYHIKHKINLSFLLTKAIQVANYAVENKSNRKLLTSKYVKHIGLPSSVSNQILRKYGRGTIKKASNVGLIVPNQLTTSTMKNGTSKTYTSIDYINERVILKPLKMSFRWNPGRQFEKINQVEISDHKFMITATFKNTIINQQYNDTLGIDLNCGGGRSVANCANSKNNEILNLGKKGPNVRKYYYKKRCNHKIKGNKEHRIMKDLDHKISRKIVDYALKYKLAIVMENLKGIRKRRKKGNGSKVVNRFVNSWSFYRLQTFIEYKSKERGIPFIKINPQYTSQECSYCSVIGERKKDIFICNNKRCEGYKRKRHSDINAAFNIGQRSLLIGGRAHRKS